MGGKRRQPLTVPLAALLGTGLVLGACAGRQHGPATSDRTPAPADSTTQANPAAKPASRGAGAAIADAHHRKYSAVERSALREKALSFLSDMARSKWELLRANAVEGLQAAPSRCEPIVRAALVDENIGVRYVAAMTIGKLKLASLAPMTRPLLNDPSPSVRAAAVYALARNGVKVDQTELSSTLMNGETRDRANVAFILGELGNTSAAALLRDAAREPSAADASSAGRLYRLQVAEALVKLGDLSARRAIDAALYPSSGEDLEASVLAAQIIGGIHDSASAHESARQLVSIVETPAPNTTVPADPRRGQFQYPKELRLAAAGALANMGYPGGWYVGDMYAQDPSLAVRAQAAGVLARTATGPTLNASLEDLERLMDDDSPLVQVSAAAGIVSALQRLGS